MKESERSIIKSIGQKKTLRYFEDQWLILKITLLSKLDFKFTTITQKSIILKTGELLTRHVA